MIEIHFVGDGPRDEITVPHLIESILGESIGLVDIAGDKEFAKRRQWKNIRVGGYARKLLFAIQDARDAQAMAVVAVVDRDRESAGDRMRKLREGLDTHRSKNPPFPTALGEANPHGEAWLLDDQAAVRRVLGLAEGVVVVSVRKTKNPKESLSELIRQSSRREENIMDLLAEISKEVNLERCDHARETGLHHLREDLEDELGPITKQSTK